MKKFFAFAIALVAMATSMVSCNNDNADFVEQKAPVATQTENRQMVDIDFVVAVTPGQYNCFDETYVIEFAGKQSTVAVSEMTPANAQQIAAFAEAKVVAESAELGEIQYYAYRLGQVNGSSSSAKIVSHKMEVKANHPSDKINVMDAACFVIDGSLAPGNRKIEAGGKIDGTDEELAGYANVISQRTY